MPHSYWSRMYLNRYPFAVSDLNLTKEYVENTIRELQSEFSRYKLLKDYLDGTNTFNVISTYFSMSYGAVVVQLVVMVN